MIYVIHVIESFSGGSLDVVRALTGIKQIDAQPVRHKVIHGWRVDSPSDPHAGFDATVELIAWPHVTREIRPVKDLCALVSLVKILKGQPAGAVLHLHSSKAGFLGRLAVMMPGCQFSTVYTSHGVAMLRQDIGESKKRLYARLERLAACQGGKVIACSGLEQQVFAAAGVKAKIIANGVQDFPGLSEFTKLHRIVAVGRLTEAKDPHFFVQLANAAQQEGLELEFVWVGDGHLAPVLQDQPVRLTGWLAQAQVIEQFRQAQLLVSTSLWEGLSLAALQAMGAGVPLLIRRGTGNNDLLTQEGFALGFDAPTEAMNHIKVLLANPEKLRSMGQRARAAFLQHYTIEAMQQNYVAVYRQVLAAE